MAIIKCKMCGGDIVLNEEKTFGTCEYCGSVMTLPKVSDEQRAALFNRGNHFRRIGEFDKALAIYENIVREDDNDAEAHWCCALCRFGIEYVADPNTYEYLPTCHRASFDSFLEDPDCKAALEHSDGVTRRQYQKDAAKIAEVQRGILATSQNEEPYDVFICYKETDDQTKERTRDSLDAQEIYYQLTQAGYRTFFSRITLEDKAGTEYEPYIFAALNSAKVMVAIGSKPEYFNAVWVKNEWSRFLALMRKDRSKLLLPCYKNMDPYDLPEQLGVLQSYDMAKIGFMQDLIRGIKKVLDRDEPKTAAPQPVVQQVSGPSVEPLLKRAFMFLEDGEWEKADDFCEQVLNQDPENAHAYLGKLMAEQHVHRQDALAGCEQPFDQSSNYQKAVRFGDETLSSALRGYVSHITERNESARLNGIYDQAVSTMNSANSKSAYTAAAEAFKTIPGFKDADSLAQQCLEKAEEHRRIENEKRRMTIEKKKRKIAAIAAALKAGSEGREEPTPREKLAKSKKRIESLTALRSEFDALLAQASQLEQEHAAAASREEVLTARRAKLGIFAAKEKKQIGEELSVLAARKRELNDQIERNAQQRFGFSAREDLEREISREEASASELEALIASYTDGEQMTYSYRQAITAYVRDLEVGRAVNAVLYPTASKDSIVFGKYIQTIDGEPEPIEWLGFFREVDKEILLISKYALDCQQYNTTLTDVTWETCSLRKWLNGTFLNAAFSKQEQAMIQRAKVSADRNPKWTKSPGNDTMDKVFLLSISECNWLFSGCDSDRKRQCEATEYASSKAGNEEAIKKRRAGITLCCSWWLRTIGAFCNQAAFNSWWGGIDESGAEVDKESYVRPALRIKVDN